MGIESPDPVASREDDAGLEAEQERDSEIEVPFDPSKIDIVVKPMSFSSLKDRLANGELDLTPDFQRHANVWDLKRKSRLIESILLRIPLPSFYFSEDADGTYSVVDGLQRFCAVFHFVDAPLLNRAIGSDLGRFRLSGLQYLKELEGNYFDELDRKFQRRITELEIAANIIRANTPIAVKFNVFARLNQGGVALNAQEIRNAIFPGEWRRHIREMAESKEFLTATEKKIHTNRQQDMELALRFAALWQLGAPYRRPPSQTLDEFLNEAIEKHIIKWTDAQWIKVKKDFSRSIAGAQAIFGKHVFRKSYENFYRTPINRGLFEAQLLAVSQLSDAELKVAIERKASIVKVFANSLASDDDFNRALLYGTGSSEASNTRLSTFMSILRGQVRAN